MKHGAKELCNNKPVFVTANGWALNQAATVKQPNDEQQTNNSQGRFDKPLNTESRLRDTRIWNDKHPFHQQKAANSNQEWCKGFGYIVAVFSQK